MKTRASALTIIGLGVVLALVSVLADPLGIGGQPGFGWKQLLGLIVGVLGAAAGLWRLFRQSARRQTSTG